MQNLAPRLIAEAESKRLGIQHGWYGTRVNGTLMTGPCATRDECLQKIDQVPEPAAKTAPATEDNARDEGRDKSRSAGVPFGFLLRGSMVRTAYQMGHKFSRPGNQRS
jgi:hypothetical protein